MASFLVIVLIVLGMLIASGALTAGLVLGSARRRLRIIPKVRTRAPVLWLWSPSLAAQQHRRLRNAASLARITGSRHDVQGWVGSEFPSLIRQLEGEALRIESQLVRVGRHRNSKERRRLLAPVEDELQHLEGSVARLVTAADDWSSCALSSGSSASVLDTIDDRIDAIGSAAREIRRLEPH